MRPTLLVPASSSPAVRCRNRPEREAMRRAARFRRALAVIGCGLGCLAGPGMARAELAVPHEPADPIGPAGPSEPLAPTLQLARAIARQGKPAADLGGNVGLVSQWETDRPRVGFELGVGASAERYHFGFKLGVLFDASPDSQRPSGYTDYHRHRFQFGYEFGYKLRLVNWTRLFLVPTFALQATVDRTHFERGAGGLEPGQEAKGDRSRWAFTPTPGMSLLAGPVEIGYRYSLDVRDARLSAQGVVLGLRF